MDKLTFAQLSAIAILTLMPLLSGIWKDVFDMISAEVRRRKKDKEDNSNGR